MVCIYATYHEGYDVELLYILALSVFPALCAAVGYTLERAGWGRIALSLCALAYVSLIEYFITSDDPLSVRCTVTIVRVLVTACLIISIEQCRKKRMFTKLLKQSRPAPGHPGHPVPARASAEFHECTLEGDVGEDMYQRLRRECDAAASANKGLRVTLRTCGGCMNSAKKIEGLLQQFAATRPLEVIAADYCMSAGVYILAALPTRVPLCQAYPVHDPRDHSRQECPAP